ncbi:MAG TPA: type II toxin-antitoxin system VapC family toxin [Verrucomicrobiales bacterium]|nr:type II toxin-antitoxin system VapC family toxin [Verrucomicrobiales bacterium]
MMIILDTNVVSELMREAPDQKVKKWLGSQKPIKLALSTISIAEIQRGLARLPKGRRRKILESSFSAFVTEAFDDRIFSFDVESAYAYGRIAAMREKAGFNTDTVDLMIVDIAQTQETDIATRNVKDFEGCGVKVINPWD